MDHAKSPHGLPKPRGVSGLFPTLKNFAPSKEFHRPTATFRDRNIENDYRQYLVNNVLSDERALAYWWTLIYFLFGILDFLVIEGRLIDVIIARWAICTPIALLLISLSYIGSLKRWYPHLFTLGVFFFAMSIVWMISILPADDPPPYVIGILTVYIFAACVFHMPFRAAATAFAFTAIAYGVVISAGDKFSHTQVVSGYFFMVSSTILAIATNYIQEIRSRILWRQGMLRERDAERIRELLIEATAADQSKINFLSMMSHELRTPLHQIIGFSEIVRNDLVGADNDNDDNENAAHVDQIHVSANTLLERIKKMLRYADASAGKINYDPVRLDISEIVDASLEQLRGATEKKAIEVNTSGLERASLTLDFFHTAYALNNILENAVNASPFHGRVDICGATNPDGAYVMTVKDEGAGMSKDKLAGVMRAFTQGEALLNRSSEGLGLGLTLAGKILNDQGAELSLASEEGKGTRVSIVFSNAAAAETLSA